jgi:hypothetical protein
MIITFFYFIAIFFLGFNFICILNMFAKTKANPQFATDILFGLVFVIIVWYHTFHYELWNY